MNFIISSFLYVSGDQYFLIAMGLTTLCGIFIGAVLYDGILKDVTKAVVGMLSYATLLALTNIARVEPLLAVVKPENAYMPMASIATIIYVSLFYALGLFLGVFITSLAHKSHAPYKS